MGRSALWYFKRLVVALDGSEPPAPVANAVLQVLLFTAGAVLCAAHGLAELPFTFDNQTYFYLAERVASGVAPHVSLVDHKFALSSILSGAAISLGRLLELGDVASLRAVSVAAAAASVTLVAATALTLTRSWVVMLLAGLIMLGFNDFYLQGAMGARPKVFVVLFTAAALHATVRERHLQAGLLAGAATLCWQPAFLVPLALVLASLLRRDGGVVLWRLVAGGAVALVCYEAYFLWHGALAEQLSQSFVMASDSTTGFRRVRNTIPFLIGEGVRRQGVVRIFPVLFLVVSAAGLVWAMARPRRTFARLRERPGCFAIVICSYLVTAYTVYDHQAYPDRFILYPFFGLCGAVTLHYLLQRSKHPGVRVIAASAAIAVAAYVVVDSVHVTKDRAVTLDDQIALAARVEEMRVEHGPVWAVSCVHLLALERRANHTPYGVLFDGRVRRYIQRRLGQKPYLPLKDGEMPQVVLIARSGEFRAIPWLPMAYRQVDSKLFARHGIRVWLYEGFKAAPEA